MRFIWFSFFIIILTIPPTLTNGRAMHELFLCLHPRSSPLPSRLYVIPVWYHPRGRAYHERRRGDVRYVSPFSLDKNNNHQVANKQEITGIDRYIRSLYRSLWFPGVDKDGMVFVSTKQGTKERAATKNRQTLLGQSLSNNLAGYFPFLCTMCHLHSNEPSVTRRDGRHQ